MNQTVVVSLCLPCYSNLIFISFFFFFLDGGGTAAHVAHPGERGGSLSSVLRDLVKPGDENLREMNKKLQNMLEEQLTKNMHLQKVMGVGWGGVCFTKVEEQWLKRQTPIRHNVKYLKVSCACGIWYYYYY